MKTKNILCEKCLEKVRKAWAKEKRVQRLVGKSKYIIKIKNK